MPCKKYLPYLAILSLAFVTALCTLPDEFDPDNYNFGSFVWEPGLNAPLVNGDLSIKDLLTEFDEEGFLSEDDSAFLFFVYETSNSLSAEEYIPDIPDQEFLQIFFSLPYDLPPDSLGVLWDTTLYTDNKSYEFARSGDERLDSIELKAGRVVIDIDSDIHHAGYVEVHSDKICEDGQPFMRHIEISDSTGTFESHDTVDISGFCLILDNTSDPDTTFMDLVFDFYLINSGNSILMSEEVTIIMRFEDLEFRKAFGYAGTFDSLIVDGESMDFDLLEGNFEGSVSLYDPQLHLDIMNSFGIEFGVELLDVEGRFEDGSGTAINIDPADNPIVVDYPGLDSVGYSVPTNVSIDRSNSNIADLASTDLRGIDYSVRAFANPGAATDNFLLDTSRLDVNLEVMVPLHLKIEDVVLTDTFEFELPDSVGDIVLEPEDLVSAFINIETGNGLPLDLELQVFFLDTTSSWTPLDSLFDDTNRHLLKSGILDPVTSRVIARKENTARIEVDQAMLERIWDVNTIIVKAYLETSKDTQGEVQFVKFYSDNSLYFKVGAGARISIKLD